MKAAIVVALVAALAVPAAARPDRSAEVRAAVTAAAPATLGVVEVAVPRNVARARGAIAIAWPSAPRPGWVSVSVTVGAGRHPVTGWVRVELAELRAVLVATRTLHAGATIGDGDLALEPRPTPGLAIDPAALAGAAVTRDLAAGVTVGELDVAIPPATARGTELDVVFSRGALTVSTRGTLESDARIGDDVRVRVSTTHTILHGRMRDGATVVVQGDAP